PSHTIVHPTLRILYNRASHHEPDDPRQPGPPPVSHHHQRGRGGGRGHTHTPHRWHHARDAERQQDSPGWHWRRHHGATAGFVAADGRQRRARLGESCRQ